MGWTPGFISRLEERVVRPQFVVQSIRPPYPVAPGGWTATGSPLVSGTVQLGALLPFSGTSVDTFTWSAQPGTFGFEVVGDTHRFRENVWRGQLVVVKCGFPGMNPATWEPIAVGSVWSVSGTLDRLTVQCLDILGTMRSRYTATQDEQSLFFDYGVSTDITETFFFGTDTTMTVTSTTGFSTAGVILIDHDRLPDGPYYLSYTGKTGTTFTGVSTTAKYGTTGQGVGGTAGATVTQAAAFDAHPVDLALQIVASTGGATNGTYDVLTESAGFGFASWLIDQVDAEKFKTYATPASGTGNWDIVSDAPQVDGYAWLQSWLQLGGFFLTHRQGQITVRGAQLLTDGTTTAAQRNGVYWPGFVTVTDADLDATEYPEWDAWDSSHGVEYNSFRVQTATGGTTTTEAVSGLPAEYRYTDNLDAYVRQNESNQRALIASRLKQWRLRIPERLTLRWVSPRLAQCAAGDPVKLQIKRAAGRLKSSSAGYADHWGMVVRNDVDWQTMTGRIAIAIPPDKADEFGA